MYKITLADGTVIDNLVLNGDNYIAQGMDVDEKTFEGKLSEVVISCDDPEVPSVTLVDAVLAKCENIDNQTWIVLREKTSQEKAQEKLEAILTADSKNIVDLQLAIVELYEMIINP